MLHQLGIELLHELQLKKPDEWRTSVYGQMAMAGECTVLRVVPIEDQKSIDYHPWTFCGLRVELDNSVPPDEIRLYSKGEIVGAIKGVGNKRT